MGQTCFKTLRPIVFMAVFSICEARMALLVSVSSAEEEEEDDEEEEDSISATRSSCCCVVKLLSPSLTYESVFSAEIEAKLSSCVALAVSSR